MKTNEPYLRGENAERAIQEALDKAQSAGLSSAGITALQQRDRTTFKRELDKLPMSSIYRASEGYAAWFAMASDIELSVDYNKCERDLKGVVAAAEA